jgi:hypothetical protein
VEDKNNGEDKLSYSVNYQFVFKEWRLLVHSYRTHEFYYWMKQRRR